MVEHMGPTVRLNRVVSNLISKPEIQKDERRRRRQQRKQHHSVVAGEGDRESDRVREGEGG